MACHHVTARVVATWQARSGRRRLLRHAAERAPSGGALAHAGAPFACVILV